MTDIRDRIAGLLAGAHRTLRVHVIDRAHFRQLRVRLAEVRDMSAAEFDGGDRADDIVAPSVQVAP